MWIVTKQKDLQNVIMKQSWFTRFNKYDYATTFTLELWYLYLYCLKIRTLNKKQSSKQFLSTAYRLEKKLLAAASFEDLRFASFQSE